LWASAKVFGPIWRVASRCSVRVLHPDASARKRSKSQKHLWHEASAMIQAAKFHPTIEEADCAFVDNKQL
jgi:hypothetical protein